MQAHRLPNGNLMVPQRVTDAEDTTTGDVLVEIGPQDPEYRRWLDWVKRGRNAARRARKPGRAAEKTQAIWQKK